MTSRKHGHLQLEVQHPPSHEEATSQILIEILGFLQDLFSIWLNMKATWNDDD